MKDVFTTIMDKYIAPFFKANGFETKDINSETNKILGAESFYFFKIADDFNRNFYFEENYDNSPEKYEFKLDFGIYSYDFFKKISFPTFDYANGLGCTFSLTGESMHDNGEYYYSITPETDEEAFAERLLENIQNTILEFGNAKTVVELLPLFLKKQGSVNINYSQMIRYLKITENQALLDSYVAQIRSENTDGSDSSKWFLAQIEECLSDAVLKEKVKQNFTLGMKVPKSWEKVLDWIAKNPHIIISGLFEINDNSNNMVPHWCDPKSIVSKSIAVIGENAAQDIFCIWQKNKKEMPIVWIGEGGIAHVIAENIDDFIELLAVGYYEVEDADYANPPVFEDYNADCRNPDFQTFYKKTFKKEVPKTGAEIIARKTTSNDEFFNWLCDNDEIWKQWK